MKIQLTKTKTIEIGGRSSRAPADVVGVELTGGDPRGCPAVRLVRRRGKLHLTAAGFVPPPPKPMPKSWDELDKNRVQWSLPPAFQAPAAAVVVDGAEVVSRQTSLEAICSEAGVDRMDLAPGKPVSRGGSRLVVAELADDGFVLEAGLPEYEAIWLGRLFPEGRRPTVASVQVGPADPTEAVSLRLLGRTTKSKPVDDFMERLRADAFTNELVRVEQPDSYPKINAFRQEAGGEGAAAAV